SFVLLEEAVADDLDGDGLAGLAGSEGQRAAGRQVVAAGRGAAVGRRPVHRHRRVIGGRKGDGKSEWRLADVALTAAHGADREMAVWLVVHDGALPLAVGEESVGRIDEVDEKRLVRLDEAVAVDGHGDGLARFAWGEGQCAADRLVVAAGRGAAVGG